MMQAELRVVGGKQDGKIIPLTTPKFLIGREQDCQLRPNSELVSRHHCVFTLDNYGLRLRDLGSTNGTLVNGERLRGQCMLQSGDHVHIGKLEFEVHLREASAAASSKAPEVDEVLNALSADTATLESSETSFELPIPEFARDGEPGATDATHDTTIVLKSGSEELPSSAEAPQHQQAEPQHEPPAEEPVAAGQPAYNPAAQYGQYMGYPQQPAMYPPMPYGQMPYQPMPHPYGMPQYPMPGMYPQGPGMYPQQPTPYPQPQQFEAPSDETPESFDEDERSSGPPVRLPDPTTTGARAPEPKPEEGGQKPAAQSDAENPSKQAADIIKRYMQRRPD